jgi:glycosyltransferase involved in cell wall biosynthesis
VTGAPIRIGHVSAYYAPAFRYGGPPRSIHGLCLALHRRGTDVRVFTTDADGPEVLPAAITAAGSYEGVPVRYFPRNWPVSPIGSRTLRAALRSDLPSLTAVHIHGMWNRVTWSAAREAHAAGRPYVVSPRGMLQQGSLAHHAWRKRAAFAVFERAVLAQAALIHATSDEEAAAIAALELGPRVVVIPNGVAVQPQVTRRTGSLPFTVVFVGRLHPIKRLDLLIDAFVELRTTIPHVRLAMAGPDEAGLRRSLEARAGSAAEAIAWHGTVSTGERDALLASAGALVLCSDSESFGMSVVEAMAAGTPVVVTTSCGWREVERHETGIRVPQDSREIAAALLRIARDPEAARAMGERGRRLVESRYTWPRVADAFVAEYEQLGDRRPSP